MATSQEQLSASDLERDGVKYSGYTDTSSSVHRINEFRLASRPNAKKHLPCVPGYPKGCAIYLEYDLVCLFAWNPPRVGCSCEDHPSSVHCKPKYYALEYQMQHIEIDHPDSQVTIKNVYFGPLNRCTLTLDIRKEHLFRVRCTNDGMNFGPYSGVFSITHNEEDLEYLPLDALYEDVEKGSPPKPKDDSEKESPLKPNSEQESPLKPNSEQESPLKPNSEQESPLKPKDNSEQESPLKPKDNSEQESPLKPKDNSEQESPLKPKEDQNAGEDDKGNDNKEATSASGSPTGLSQYQSSTLLTSSVILMISTDPFTWSPKDMLFVRSKNYKPDKQLARECPKALFAIMPATPKSSEAEHPDDPKILTETEETILDDANKQKDNKKERFSSTSSSFHELSSYISDISTYRSVSSATLSTLAACSWPFTARYYEEYCSILAQMIKDSPLCCEENK